MPINYGHKVDDDLLKLHKLDKGVGISEDTLPWDWVNDCFYIKAVMNKLYPGEKFIFIVDDWSGGILSHFASRYSDLLKGIVYIDPIAFDGYTVNEIQAIGRASMITDKEEFAKAMGEFYQTLVQIFKTMVHNPDEVWNQYSLRAIMCTYVDVDYERPELTVLRWD